MRIVAIRRDNSILLAQHTRQCNGIHGRAGWFVEVGSETLEQAVARSDGRERGLKKPALCYLPAVAVPAVADDGLYGRL